MNDPWQWLGHGGGEMGRRIRETDWARTSVGPVERWPESLRSLIYMMLHARQPMFLWWGPDLVQFYNDGYVPSFGVGRHPWALGQRGEDCWGDIWSIIGPEIQGVLATAQATFHEDALVPIFRNSRTEEVYWTYGYSPVIDASGRVAGVLVVVTETTTRVVALRRLRMTRALAESIVASADRDELARDAVRAIGSAPNDAPWALAYRSDDRSLLATCHVDAVGAAAIIERIEQHAALGRIAAGDRGLDLAIDLGLDLALPGGPWPEPSTQAIALALPVHESGRRDVIVIGQSPRLPFDETHRADMQGLERQLAAAALRIDSQTARLAAEIARKDLLLQAPFAAALLVGPEWRFTLANDLYEQMVGRRVGGRTWHECFPELRGTPVEAILRGVYRDGATHGASEQHVPLVHASGGVEDRYFDFNMIPIRSAAGTVEAMMVVAIEVTTKVVARRDIERIAAERATLVRELEDASRAKDEFLAMMGHELRNPLAPISTALSLLRTRGTVSVEHEIIERQVNHMTRLVDDLLDISRVTQGKVELRKSVVSVTALAAHAVELASALFDEREHHLSVHVEPERWWLGDETRLEQVISNLLTNAARYTEPGGHIELHIETAGDILDIRVRDDGRGIEPELLAKVFEPFIQSDRGPDRREGGLGLGLAIVKALVAAHGGIVEADSEGAGCGSEFRVRVPGVVAPPPAKHPTPSPDLRRGEARRILLVDDNQDAATLIAELLELAGYQVVIAHDGPSALILAASARPEIAILDIGLPVMDGFELVQRLREQANGCRYIALTGYGRPEDTRRAREVGFERLLVKPVVVKTLLEAISGSKRQ